MINIERCLGAVLVLLLTCGSLLARPEEAVPAGAADMVMIVDFDRPVQLVTGVRAMTGEMILSIADKCEDAQDAKAALCLRRLRSGVEKPHSLAMFVSGDDSVIILEADLTAAFKQKLNSVGRVRTFGRHRALAATFKSLWGDEAGSLEDESLVVAPGGRLLLGTDDAVVGCLDALSARSSYLPTFGRDTGLHYLVHPSAVGLEAYEKLGARLLVMDMKAGPDGKDSLRFELKCESAKQASALRPRVIADYLGLFSPMIHRMARVEDPDVTLKQVQSKLKAALGEQCLVRDNSIILEVKDAGLDMNPEQLRIYIEDVIVMAFKAGK